MPSPGLKGVFDATLDVTARRFRVLILSTGEDLVSLGCTDETVQPQKVVEVGVGGSRYVLSWAAIGADRGGTYRAAVHRNGAAASESIVLHAMGEVSC
ncbi:hypothetical protein [Kitasatospora phosalacinea]|nr:hypothetical protein [Kitasatospora phosalacinea]